MKKIKFDETLNETVYFYQLSSGIKCYIIPKKDYAEKQAVICVNYGSADNKFKINEKVFDMPDGVAHFLEHKLFENKDLNIFDQFINLGGSANAFTNYSNTAYYFNCIDRFEDNLRLLLRFTEEPYFTDENVEKEKGIIAQEINMYSDNPFWRVILNMQEAMYKESPVRKNIAGTLKSISGISKEILYQCYDAFYHPTNMALICVGDVDADHIADLVDKNVSAKKTAPVVERMYGNEQETVEKGYTEQIMAVSRPMFNMGFKEMQDVSELDMAERMAVTKIAMDVICGESSEFFGRLYDGGVIDGPFGMDYTCGNFYGMAVFSCSAQEPKIVSERLLDEINIVKEGKIDEQRFGQIKRKHLGRFERGFNIIDNISMAMVDLFSKQMDIIDLYDGYKDLTPRKLATRLDELFHEDNHVLSVVRQRQTDGNPN